MLATKNLASAINRFEITAYQYAAMPSSYAGPDQQSQQMEMTQNRIFKIQKDLTQF